MSAMWAPEMSSEKSMMRPFAPRVTASSLSAKNVRAGLSRSDTGASLSSSHGSASPSHTTSMRRFVRCSATTSPARADDTMAMTPSSLEFAKKPRRPKLMPRMGTPAVPIWRAVRRMVPSPPSTTVIATPAARAAFTSSWSQRHERSDESTSV